MSLARPEGVVPDRDPRELDPVRVIIAEVLEAHPDGTWLGVDAVSMLLDSCGLSLMPYRLVGSADEAVAAATAFGDPVVVKATGLDRLSKSEAGGVALDVHGPDEVRAAYERMLAQLGEAMSPAMVQAMAPAGVDVRVAAHQEPSYGAVISLGLGGSVAQANPQRSVRVLPLTDVDARWMVDASPLGPLLLDHAPTAVRHLEALLLDLAWIVEHVPELADVELVPVVVAGGAASITAARVRVAPAKIASAPDVRRLR